MRKLTILFISVLLVVTFSLTALGVDLGFTQDSYGYTNARVDGNYFLGELRLGTPNQLTAGAKIPFARYFYATSTIDFQRDGSNPFKMQAVNVGAGAASNTTVKIRGEVTVTNPNWNEYGEWGFNLKLGLQYAFGNPFTGGGE